MANYSLIVDSRYSPFTFEELLKPALLATKAHQELEAQYDDLTTKASAWEEMANKETDPYAYGLYSKYAEDLKAQADLLATQGLTPSSRKALLDMKGRYSKEITPIEEAYTTRQKLIDEQREALLRDNTLIFDKDYTTVSLDDIIKNPNASYTPLSGKDIATRTAAMAKEAATSILSDPEYTEVFNSQYIQQKIMQGYDMSQILAAAQRDPNAPAALLGIVDTIKQQVGYDNWDAQSQAKIDKYINEGLSAATGTPKIEVVANRAYMTPLERERAQLQNELLGLQKAQADAAAYGIPTPGGGRIIKLGGNQWIEYDKDGKVVNQQVSQTPEEKAALELEGELVKQNSLKGIKKLGFTPVGAVAKLDGTWTAGVEGDDMMWLGTTRSQVINNWGEFTYTPDNDEEITYVLDISTIPGFSEEFMMGTGTMPDKNTAFGQIIEAARNAGITDAEFRSNRVIIAKVRAEGNRSEPYDYVIFRKN